MNEKPTFKEDVKKVQSDSMITILLFWCGFIVLCSLYLTIPLVSAFATAFKVSTSQSAFVGSIFSLLYAVGLLIAAPLSHRYNSKSIILFGLIALTVVTPFLGLSSNFTMLIIFRGLQGMVAGIVPPTLFVYIFDKIPAEKRVTKMGFVSTGFLVAGIIGQVYSILVSQQWGWQSVFYILSIIYLISVFWVAFFLPKGKNKSKTWDLQATFKQMVTTFLKKSLVLCYVISILILFTFVGMYSALGSYLGENFELNSQHVLYIRAVGIVGMLLAPFAGRMSAKFGTLQVLRGGIALAVLGLCVLGISSNLWLLIVMSVVFVAGIAIVSPTIISAVGQLGKQLSSAAISIYSFFLFLGAFLGPNIASMFVRTHHYRLTFGILALFLTIGFVCSLVIKMDSESGDDQ